MDPVQTSPRNGGSAAPLGTAGLKRFFYVTLVILLVGLAVGLVPRWLARRTLAQATRELAVTTVAVVSPAPGKGHAGTPLPAEIQPILDAPIYARAGGYLKRRLVDLGAVVKAGQLLAEIDTPELDQQLAQARAEVAQDQAALDLAQVTAIRWAELLKTASVSEQEAAEKKSDLDLKQATLAAGVANLHRLEELKGFAKVVAPFDGTITARETEVGQLIVADSGRELFHLAQLDPLRVFVRVPQPLAPGIVAGRKAELLLDAGRKVDIKVVRTAGAIDAGSRTLLTELAVENPQGDILSGSYAQVRFVDDAVSSVLTLSANTLLFRLEGARVGVVGADGVVELRAVKLGRDFGQTVEVLDGIAATDRVIVNPPDALTDGLKVNVAEPATGPATAGATK